RGASPRGRPADGSRDRRDVRRDHPPAAAGSARTPGRGKRLVTAREDEASSTEREAPNRMPIGAFEASLPRAAYVDPAYLDRERDGIFWSEWVVAGLGEQVGEPGDCLGV